MIKIAKQQVKDWQPCDKYRDNNYALLNKLYGKKKSLTLNEIILLADKNGEPLVPEVDILWLILRDDVVGEKVCRLAAGVFAEHTLVNYESKYPNDYRPRVAVETCMGIALGNISIDSAAWSAARSAAIGAEDSAAWSAAWSAAMGAEDSAAWSAEREYQLFALLMLIAEYCD